LAASVENVPLAMELGHRSSVPVAWSDWVRLLDRCWTVPV